MLFGSLQNRLLAHGEPKRDPLPWASPSPLGVARPIVCTVGWVSAGAKLGARSMKRPIRTPCWIWDPTAAIDIEDGLENWADHSK